MKFCLNLFNHNELGQKSLHDVISIIAQQIKALGHEVVWDRDNKAILRREEGMNLIVEGFTAHELYGSVARIKEAYDQGARFVCIATEEPGELGFNQGTSREMIKRQEVFPLAARYFDGILHLVPGDHVGNWFRQFCPTAYVELGYAPTLLRPGENFIAREPKYDFGFFGSMSRRRYRILKQLARTVKTEFAVRVVASFPSQEERDEAMRDSRVIVQIRKFDEMGLVSSSRCNTALCVGRPVVAEPHLLSKPWDEIVHFSATLDDFYHDCFLARTNWRSMRDQQFERFRTRLTPEFCIGKPLRDIGILDAPRRAA